MVERGIRFTGIILLLSGLTLFIGKSKSSHSPKGYGGQEVSTVRRLWRASSGGRNLCIWDRFITLNVIRDDNK